MEPITINPNRIDLDEAYLSMAEIWALRSKANRKQVGALIVKDRQIISDGYNGMPAGDADDTCEHWVTGEIMGQDVLATKPGVLHAESNALMKIAENGGVGAQGATLYTTMSPCSECAKLIKQAKIKRVVFRELYRDNGGIEFLRTRGVIVEQKLHGSAPIAPPKVVTPAAPPVAQPPVAQPPVAQPPVAQPPVAQPPVAPPVPGQSAFVQPSDAEIAALLAQAQAMQAQATAQAAKVGVVPAAEGPYRSTFM
jgi:dCMP deaminase